MGLDVSHLELTLTPNDKGCFLYADDWDIDCNVPLENYSKYITTITDLDFNKTIAIVKSEDEFENFKKIAILNSTEYLKVFIGEINEIMRKKLSRYIVNQKLDKLKSLELGCEQDGIKYNTISFGEPIKVQGVYYLDNIGYQRRGMNSLFYDTFKNHMLWGKKEDFELAYTCVAGEWYLKHRGKKEVNRMKKNFKENFVDKFEFGKSLLCASF